MNTNIFEVIIQFIEMNLSVGKMLQGYDLNTMDYV